ncbi:GDSL-type esterase/lipase family protein [Pseudodesulfovibrio thermohalotolerans]|uniref:GDSL-type esterase/lipase family protein n=1 Tax=Pseudodesulfovibrio thermohalotolerans TaxID=2880651 RepID=UPI0022BA0937|nr:GDSL-type esterase/lipase family protein [Pseudodesulfovibrio thermohalotolerans]WFS63514.1 GDSL-type esterase/lipase family protein [Pseudodesulfovibrio thermohalotolerans]
MITFFIGDSLTLGCGDATGLGWPGRIATVLMRGGRDLTWYNLGVRANTTIKLRDRWRDEVARRFLPGQNARLIFSFGVADIANDVPAQTCYDNAEAILSEAKDIGPTLFIGPMPVGDPDKTERITQLSLGLETVCDRLGVPCVPVIQSLKDSAPYASALAAYDNVHPAAEGYDILAELLLKSDAVRNFLDLENDND